MFDPVKDSLRFPLVVAFSKSRSSGYQTAVQNAQMLSEYRESADGKSIQHYCPITASREEFARAATIIHALHGSKSLEVYINGRPVLYLRDVIEVLECFLTAKACRDPKAHCHIIHNEGEPYGANPNISVTIYSEEPPKTGLPQVIPRFVFPCSHLYRQFRFTPEHHSSMTDKIQAAGVKCGCQICPLFKPDDFMEISPKVIHADGTVE